MKIAMIVEDMPESQQMLREVVSTAFPGIHTYCAFDVAGALKMIRQFQFDLVLIDLSLPDGEGGTVIEAVSARFPESVIVVATIFDDDSHLFPALRAGTQGYLLKDEEPELLVKQLQGIRECRPPLSPAVARRILTHFHEEELRQANAQEVLSPREREVLGQLARGISITTIAQEMGISHHTVGDHVKNIYRKLNISSRAEAALQARNMGLM